jgi:UDP-glucose:(heptosyl)LPS alpha-1,3-glucosyltransferase
MKIGIVIRRLNTQGGTERRTSELIRCLLKAGHEIHLFAEAWEKGLARDLTCHRLPILKPIRWIKALSFALFAAHAVRKYDLDLIHSQARTYADDLATLGGGCHADYLDHFLENATPLRRAWEFNAPFNRTVMALERAQYRRCSRLILNSHLALEGLVRHFPWAAAKCRVVHNGIDCDSFKPDANSRAAIRRELQVKEDTIIYLFVGSGFERKGLPEFLQSLEIVSNHNSTVDMLALVVGNGDFPRYRAQAKQLGIDEKIIFAGAKRDTRPYYCAADVFVLPTKFDPFANTTNEALASGLPVITTKTNGACEVITDEVGFVVKRAGEVDEMAAAMESLLDAARRKTMSASARQNALARPWELTADLTMKVYHEILAERKK